jgi:hypothetical protein
MFDAASRKPCPHNQMLDMLKGLEFDEAFDACADCGISAWRLKEGDRAAHEDFYVHADLWDAVCPDDQVVEWVENGVTYREGQFVMCVGCFERRLGRQLFKEDFAGPPRRLFGVPPSYRLRSRWKAHRRDGAPSAGMVTP